jgi:DnaJ-domain-containing protein 1
MQGEFQNSNSPGRFAGQVQALLGDDSELDTVFLEESWTLGVPAAMHRRQQRRHSHADRERQSRDFRELSSLGTLSFVDAGQWLGGLTHLAAQMAVAREPAAAPPAQLTPEQSACRLLGVTAAGTREQLRAAYRRMVVAWHPDRLERGSDTRQATERMAAINAAYRLLRGALSAEPA